MLYNQQPPIMPRAPRAVRPQPINIKALSARPLGQATAANMKATQANRQAIQQANPMGGPMNLTPLQAPKPRKNPPSTESMSY